ncbi:tol-pal system protein YbgF [Jannaschia sp. 2305UL9-9]|uniref:tol-pal system protein YbgF n=1 Tax=Jannaschia sp. 2305UL9-9 TaxID=3121638 RepID=UPI003527729F
MRLAVALAILVATPLAAQDTDQTLADIRRQLSVLNTEIQSLQRELSTTGAAALRIEGTSFPDRLISMEDQLRQLTAQTERLSFRVESIGRDGGNRIEDLRFQLCELTPDCDLGALPQPGPLGEAVAATPGPAPVPERGASGQMRPVQRPGQTAATSPIEVAPTPAAPAAPQPQLAIGEESEFNAARALLDQGQNTEAAQAFERFTTNYPTGPLSTEAQFLRGEALARSGDQAGAARAYLESFSGTPEGTRAPDSLLGLGRALGALGQTSEACLTLSEVGIRFPQSGAAGQATSARAELGCS